MATSYMGAGAAKVIEDRLLRAPGLLKGIGQDSEALRGQLAAG